MMEVITAGEINGEEHCGRDHLGDIRYPLVDSLKLGLSNASLVINATRSLIYDERHCDTSQHFLSSLTEQWM